jgi:PilZ domain
MRSIFDERPTGKRTDLGFPDRRSRIRYPIALPLRYQSILSNLHYGTFYLAKTVDFASQGFLVSTDELLPEVGTRIRARVDWPVPLDGKMPLQFIVTGRVVRVAGKRFGVSFDTHELCTLKKAPGSILDVVRRQHAGSVLE